MGKSAEPFTAPDAREEWNRASGLMVDIEDAWFGWWKMRTTARYGGAAGALAVAMFRDEQRRDDGQTYFRHLTSTPEDQPVAFNREAEVPVHSAIGGAAIVATLLDRPVAAQLEDGLSVTVNPGEWPHEAVNRLMQSGLVIDLRGVPHAAPPTHHS